LGGGLGLAKGHFAETGFVIDLRRSIPGITGESMDKPWMAVDSTSGNVYLTWTHFFADQSSTIRLQRMDADLNPLGPGQRLRYADITSNYGVQVSFPAVGPDGVLYVAWQLYTFELLAPRDSYYEIVRSDDFGQTFGPVQTIANHRWNLLALPPS